MPKQKNLKEDINFYRKLHSKISYLSPSTQLVQYAKENNLTLQNEIIRLIVHSLLHLLGYDDDTKERKEKMFLKQEPSV